MSYVKCKWRGGAFLDFYNVTWPFATLTVTSELLVLKTPKMIIFGGTYQFTPEQVPKISEFGSIPFYMKGIRIHHTVPSFPECIVFWHPSFSPKWLADELKKYGYGKPTSEATQ